VGHVKARKRRSAPQRANRSPVASMFDGGWCARRSALRPRNQTWVEGASRAGFRERSTRPMRLGCDNASGWSEGRAISTGTCGEGRLGEHALQVPRELTGPMITTSFCALSAAMASTRSTSRFSRRNHRDGRRPAGCPEGKRRAPARPARPAD
jgi:hypothetical protein